MSVFGSLEIAIFGDGPDATPYVDVAHDSGVHGGQVRLICGEGFDYASRTFFTREQARALGEALIRAADQAQWDWQETT